MDLVQIRYFLALSRALNFTRAAAACNVSQPALTKSIARLEAELGGALLLRERNLTQLTEFGRIMLPLLQQTSDVAAAAKRHAIDFKKNRQQTARLRVGLAPSLPAGLFTPLFREMNRAFQGFELTASSGAAAALNDALLHGEIEVAVLDDADALAGRINRWTLFSDPAAVLMRGDHPLTAMAEIPIAALGEHALVCRTGSGGCFAAMLGTIRVELGVEVMSRHRGPDEEGVRELVRAGLGVALSTARTPVTAGLVLRPLASGARQDVVAAVVAGRPLTHAAETFMRLARARDWALTPA